MILPWPPAEFQEHAIDHGGIYQAVAGKYGAIPQMAFKSTVNFRNKKHFAFADSWIPTPLLYFEDCWQQAGMPYGPLAYGSLHSGGQGEPLVTGSLQQGPGGFRKPRLPGNVCKNRDTSAPRCVWCRPAASIIQSAPAKPGDANQSASSRNRLD